MRLPKRRSRTLRIGAVAAVLAAAAIAGGCGSDDDEGDTTAAETTSSSSGGGGSQTVELTEYEFGPNDLQVSAGDTIEAGNAGKLEHNLTIEVGADAERESKKLAATQDLQAGSSGNVTVPDDPGRHSIVCTIPGHR